MANFVGLLVVFAFLLLIGLFFASGFSQSIFNPPYLAFVLQLLFVFGIGLAVAFVSAKSYIQTGAPNILLLGNAILISSLSFTISATVLTPEIPPTLTANQAVIIGNVGVLISSLVLLVSAIVTLLGTEHNPRVPKKTILAVSFLISIATVTVISVFSALDLFPVFLTSNGPTLLRLVVLALTTIFYFASSVLFGWQYVRAKSQVVYWFSLALALFGTAYLAGVLTIHLGSAMTWVSRLALYFAGAFLLFALLGPEGKTQKQPYAAKWSEAFRSNQKQMETFFSKIGEGFAYCKIITDAEGKPVDWLYLDVNDSYERINDADRNKVVGRKATEVLPGIREDPADWINVYGHVALTGEPIVLERFSKDRNKWYHVSAYSPQKGYFVSLFEDITERKKAEETLKETERRLHVITDNSQDGINLLDLTTGKYVFMNPAQVKLTGFTAEEINNISAEEAYDRTYPDDREVTMAQQKKVASGEDVSEPVEYRWKVKSGEYRWFSDSRKLVRDEHGQAIAIVGISRDITERKKTEDALRLSEERFSKAFNLSPFAVIMTRLSDGTYVDVNDTFLKMFEYTRDEVIGHTANEIKIYAKPDGRAAYLAAFKNGRVSDFEVDLKTKTGKPLKALGFAEIINVNGQDLTFGTLVDITERKKAEEALNKLNEELEERVLKRTEEVSAERQRLYNVLETLPAYVILLDKDYCVPFANKVFRERFGESHGRRCYDFLFKRESPCENCETYKVLKTNGPHRWEWTGPDGRDYDIYDFPFVEADGSTLILEMGIDITERKRAEKQIRDVSLYSRSLIEASLDPLVTISAEGKITDVNQATELATGCSREELIGSDFSDYFTEPEKAKIGYKQVFSEGFVRDYPLAIKHKSGKITDVLYNATIYTNEAGEMQGVFAAARDITERKKAEEQAQEAAKKLKDAERLAAIGATAGMVGHDIRNPLQAITGDLFLAKSELSELPENENKTNAIESLDEIQNNIDYINKIVADLQDYARPLNPRAQETNIKSLFNEILAKNGIPKNVKVTVKVEDKAEKIMADPDYLKRIAANLTLNAVQAMPDGGKLTIHAYR